MRKFWVGLLIIVAAGVTFLALNKKQSTLSGDVANDPELVKKGQYLAIAGDCAACHTAKGGDLFAGGRAMPIPMLGTIYSRNITPDAETGIGTMTLAEFDRSVRLGVDRQGHNLYPAMPYISYAKVSDEDIKALYAFFKYGVKPVKQANKASTIPFPLDVRWPVQLWNVAFFDDKPYQMKTDHDAVWNRGAYLVQGLAHCGTCHTPRGLALQEKALDESKPGYLSGSLLAGWYAYNITSDQNSGIGSWSEDQLVQYLSQGYTEIALPAGPMAEAVQDSFSHMDQADIKAIATYVKSLPATSNGDTKPRHDFGSPATTIADQFRGGAFNNDVSDGAILFAGACGTCHDLTGSGRGKGYYPSLYKNSTVGSSHSENLINVVMDGVSITMGGKQYFMPGFRNQELSDAQLTSLLNYVTKQFGNPSVTFTEEQIKKARAASAQ